jgi:hypothetical protein
VRLYRVTFDHQSWHAETPTLGDAVLIWREAMKGEWGSDWSGDEEPDEVVLVDEDRGAIRAKKPTVPAEPGSLRAAAQGVVDYWLADGDLADALEAPNDDHARLMAVLRDVLGGGPGEAGGG